MKKYLITSITVLVLLAFVTSVFADTWVSGYFRKDGTYVSGYWRSDPNKTVRDNFSYKGNINPYTGEKGTRLYRDNPTSEYYDPFYSSRSFRSYTPSYELYTPSFRIPETEQGLVVRVIDGDTIELADGRHIRYLGINTPEAGEVYGVKASAKNRELVEGKVVELQRGNQDIDEFGRLLRYVYVNEVFVNARLVAQGYARAYIFNPDERSQVLVQLEQYAKMRKRGLWGNH